MTCEYQEFLNQIHGEILLRRDLWESRYASYARSILAGSQKLDIHVQKPLYQYTTVSSEAGKGMKSILRFCGQEVASVHQLRTGCHLTITANNADNNRKYFQAEGIAATPGTWDWHSPEAASFRKFFRDCPVARSKSPEHTLESLVLTELEKTGSKDKSLLYTAPVKIAGRRFQMPTPIRGSEHRHIHVASSGIGGGIDILARQKCGNRTYLNVIELKDAFTSREPPELVIRQAMAYAAFLRNLIRSESGELWCRIFGIRYPRESLVIRCTAAMPGIAGGDIFSSLGILPFPEGGGDGLELHLMDIAQEKDSVKLRMV